MELPSFSRSQLPGNSFQNAEADQKCRGERQQNGPGIKRNAAKRAGHMRILLWRLAEWNEGLNFSEERRLATTTGGEPVHSDAREGRNSNVHEADFIIAPKGTQASLMPELSFLTLPLLSRIVIPTEAQRSRGTCCSPSIPILSSLMEARLSPLSSRPKRTRISCHAALDKATCAPFRKEGRMKCTSATKFHRKSGVAQWRNLQFNRPVLEVF
jgi:hypothetical protein